MDLELPLFEQREAVIRLGRLEPGRIKADSPAALVHHGHILGIASAIQNPIFSRHKAERLFSPQDLQNAAF